jgi:hypothetical protein
MSGRPLQMRVIHAEGSGGFSGGGSWVRTLFSGSILIAACVPPGFKNMEQKRGPSFLTSSKGEEDSTKNEKVNQTF